MEQGNSKSNKDTENSSTKHRKSDFKKKLLKFVSKNRTYLIIAVAILLIGGGYVIYRSFANQGSYSESKLSGADGEFTAIKSARLLDTRNAIGSQKAPLTQKETRKIKITGQGGVPENEVSAVIINVTTVNATSESRLSIQSTDDAANNDVVTMSYPKRLLVREIVTKVGSDGSVNLTNYGGTVDVLFDVVGYYSKQNGTAGSRYISLKPTRIHDTRDIVDGQAGKPIAPKEIRRIQIAGLKGVPTDNLEAVTMNMTVTAGSDAGSLTVWPSGEDLPAIGGYNVKNIAFSKGETVANQVTVRVGSDGYIQIYNPSSSVHVIFDIQGYYKKLGSAFDNTEQGRFVPLSLYKIYSTAQTSNVPQIPAGKTIDIPVNLGGVSYSNVRAVVLKASVSNSTAESFLTMWPSGSIRPLTSVMNFGKSQKVENYVTVGVGSDGKIKVYNPSSSYDLSLEVVGYYINDSNSILSTNASYLFPTNYPNDGTGGSKFEHQFKVTFNKNIEDAGHMQTGATVYGDYIDPGIDLFSQNTNIYFGKNPHLEFNCKIECKSEITGHTVSANENLKTYKVPYSFVSGANYKIVQELKYDDPNRPYLFVQSGTWLDTSIIDVKTGLKTLVFSGYVGSNHANLKVHPGVNFQGWNETVCNSPQLFTITASNFKIDDSLLNNRIDISPEFKQGGEDQCPGLSKMEVLYGKIVKLSHGIPVAYRDTTLPKLVEYKVEKNKTWPYNYKLVVSATDDKIVGWIDVVIDGEQMYADGGYVGVYGQSVTKDVNLQVFNQDTLGYDQLPSGTYKATITVTDNSKNQYQQDVDITIP
ncbi:hypothetical protein KDA00_02785 [Candidatus Saccharibacteria bacterium]|nr:hypothetical protein [Candidatus Saccharibacteria bacterium]